MSLVVVNKHDSCHNVCVGDNYTIQSTGPCTVSYLRQSARRVEAVKEARRLGGQVEQLLLYGAVADGDTWRSPSHCKKDNLTHS